MAFRSEQALPGVYHIQDCMGVCMTLLTGRERALLVDTGYGVENVRAYVETITSLPCTVLLTHAHHDHALGARWFDQALLFPQDRSIFSVYTGTKRRKKVLDDAVHRKMPVNETEFMQTPMPTILDAKEETMDLGGLHAQILLCPGHTPGSAVVWVPERELLLTGDDWNPCTWLFFPEALPAQAYRENLRSLMRFPFLYVLCPHQPMLLERKMMEVFLEHLTDDALEKAETVNTGEPEGIHTAEVHLPSGQVFLFDAEKFRLFDPKKGA